MFVLNLIDLFVNFHLFQPVIHSVVIFMAFVLSWTLILFDNLLVTFDLSKFKLFMAAFRSCLAPTSLPILVFVTDQFVITACNSPSPKTLYYLLSLYHF